MVSAVDVSVGVIEDALKARQPRSALAVSRCACSKRVCLGSVARACWVPTSPCHRAGRAACVFTQRCSAFALLQAAGMYENSILVYSSEYEDSTPGGTLPLEYRAATPGPGL